MLVEFDGLMFQIKFIAQWNNMLKYFFKLADIGSLAENLFKKSLLFDRPFITHEMFDD
tara:strand:- start:1038 stop:1211 length:174 start_codon:yes stop_codon:yes gene_type:complete